MYNGIGLSSVRGSGTSGYVQTNAFNIRGHKKGGQPSRDKEGAPRAANQGPNEDVLEHNKKRAFELKVFEYRVTLEDDDVPEGEIERRVEEYRAQLTREQDKKRQACEVGGQGTHEAAARKAHNLHKLQEAFGVGGYEEGAAFTKEYHERKKEERRAAKMAREKEREDREARMISERVEQMQGIHIDAAAARTAAEDELERIRALDDELDQQKEERDRVLGSRNGRPTPETSKDEGRNEEEDESSLDEDVEADMAPSKRPRHDTESESEEDRSVSSREEEAGAPSSELTNEKTLSDVILMLFADNDVLRKKQIVAKAEELGVEFKEAEYKKQMKELATSQAGGAWRKK